MDIFRDLTPDSRDHAALWQLLVDANVARAGSTGHQEAAFLIRDPVTAKVAGGLWGRTLFGWFFVELVFVPETMRRAGAGSRLLGEAEKLARERGCVGLQLTSYAFQAPGFYEKNGFECFGTLSGQPKAGQQADTALRFYRKQL